ncbi:hypothetical protein C8Q77DRAFT_770068 [Trametes polyzona]|nr:hypothetical protein C8Q77DRAFT_770068 [Trametes polyzona]
MHAGSRAGATRKRMSTSGSDTLFNGVFVLPVEVLKRRWPQHSTAAHAICCCSCILGFRSGLTTTAPVYCGPWMFSEDRDTAVDGSCCGSIHAIQSEFPGMLAQKQGM